MSHLCVRARRGEATHLRPSLEEQRHLWLLGHPGNNMAMLFSLLTKVWGGFGWLDGGASLKGILILERDLSLGRLFFSSFFLYLI